MDNIGICNSIPPYKGIVPIVITWFFCILLLPDVWPSGSIYLITRTFILRSENSYNRSYYLLPIFVFGTTLDQYIILHLLKGAKKTSFKNKVLVLVEDWSDSKAAWIAAVIAAGLSVASYTFTPFVKKWVNSLVRKRKNSQRNQDDR